MFHVEQAQEKHTGYPHKTTNIKKPLPKEWLFNIGCFVWVSGVFFLRLFHVEHYTLSPKFYKQYIDVGR